VANSRGGSHYFDRSDDDPLTDSPAIADSTGTQSLVELVVFDFDGVFTDNAVWVREDGVELVRCSRADGLGIARLREFGISMLVLSTEENPVVTARCQKLGLPVEQGVADKGTRLRQLLSDRGVDPERVVYLGNDVNDAGCLRLVGLPVIVADAHPSVASLARIVLKTAGGHGAVRELCDAIVEGTIPTASDRDFGSIERDQQ
jgi:YrbI family 3-deoxy-D-manno-octulosonate 8-phosphate phosphatase